ncbi:uncharacterized protein ACDP82_013494 [Pangshura tecta]
MHQTAPCSGQAAGRTRSPTPTMPATCGSSRRCCGRTASGSTSRPSPGDGQAPVAAEVGDVYPATEKQLIHSHPALVCRTRHCADSLVLCLNSPARSDGPVLLWDTNKNGIADPNECYPVAELLADLEGCSARRVFLFLAQSYPGPLAKQLLASGRRGNVVLVSGQRGSQFARGSAFSEFWARLQPGQCLLQHLLQAAPRAAGSSPGAMWRLLKVTLAGAPRR